VVGKKGEKRNETKPNQTPTLFLHGGERGRQINAGVIHKTLYASHQHTIHSWNLTFFCKKPTSASIGQEAVSRAIGRS
jgi:hypothetical protein